MSFPSLLRSGNIQLVASKRTDIRAMFLFRRKRQPRTYKTIDDKTARAILATHREHPEMGRKRLYKHLKEAGMNIDAYELKLFLRAHNIGTPPPMSNPSIPPSSFPPVA